MATDIRLVSLVTSKKKQNKLYCSNPVVKMMGLVSFTDQAHTVNHQNLNARLRINNHISLIYMYLSEYFIDCRYVGWMGKV